MEVEEQSTCLLSVPKEVSDLVLSFLAPGEGGLKSILNLRAVSSTTKGWVDKLLPSQRRRILKKCEVEVELTKESLEKFLKNPSPPGMTSLRLNPSENMEEIDETLWNTFVEFWAPKLESLYLDGAFLLRIPIPFILRLCLSSPFLRRLCCFGIDNFDQDFEIELPRFMFRLEDLDIRDLGVGVTLTEPGTMDFFYHVAENKNLKHLAVTVTATDEILGVVKVVDANRDNSRLKLTLGFTLSLSSHRSKRLFKLLVASVGSSKSSISIVNLNDVRLKAIAKSSGNAQIQMTNFYEKIETLSDFREVPESPSLTAFPNLKQIGTLRCSSLRGINSICELQKLERLGVAGLTKFGAPASNFLPSSLTNLALKDVRCSPIDLVYLLNVIASNCPLLVALRIEWIRLDETSIQTDSLSALPSAPFSNLKTFAFEADFSLLRGNEGVENCRMILQEGLQIHQLSLRYFKFKLHVVAGNGKSTFDVNNSEILTLFIEGPLAKSLFVFLVEGDAYPEEAAPLVMQLKSKALSNKMKRRKTHGIRLPVTENSAL